MSETGSEFSDLDGVISTCSSSTSISISESSLGVRGTPNPSGRIHRPQRERYSTLYNEDELKLSKSMVHMPPRKPEKIRRKSQPRYRYLERSRDYYSLR